jgi:hypothetical protein
LIGAEKKKHRLELEKHAGWFPSGFLDVKKVVSRMGTACILQGPAMAFRVDCPVSIDKGSSAYTF